MFDMCDICAVTISQIRIITFQEHGGLSPNCQEKGGYEKGCMKDWYVSFNVHSFHNDIRNYSHDGWTFYSKLVWIQRYCEACEGHTRLLHFRKIQANYSIQPQRKKLHCLRKWNAFVESSIPHRQILFWPQGRTKKKKVISTKHITGVDNPVAAQGFAPRYLGDASWWGQPPAAGGELSGMKSSPQTTSTLF